MSIYETPAHCFSIEGESDGRPWFHDILEYIKNQRYPEQADENDKRTIRRMAIGFVLDRDILYKRKRSSAPEIKHHNSSPYRPKMNGAVEAANKNIKRIIGKMTETYKDWHEKLPFALYAYRTSVRTSTRATPFSLVYGMEVVLSIEVEIPSLRVLMETRSEESEWVRARYDQLNLIEGKRLKAICHGQMYQKRMITAHDKRVRPREFREGELHSQKLEIFYTRSCARKRTRTKKRGEVHALDI
ncbi:uncharacterized protein [Gossypium hirsutum]|uniref:RNA-directed DNA polymerase n=1 Tax=Gossypium hirsutum TaxID=3635 RepID=A0A1U8IY97_GOSHI|nr:uncharacterized protein LOC107900144 [Gossypium hirsutum]